MAKVKITGHASGTGILTVTAPNTSTDRTITLPDATGTLLNSDGSAANLTAIPAANITGTLPAIDGSNLTGVGVDGISSSADATAITIDATENVGFGATPTSFYSGYTGVQIGSNGTLYGQTAAGGSNNFWMSQNVRAGTDGSEKAITTGVSSQVMLANGEVVAKVAPSASADANVSWTTALTIKNDGRGLSQFTAKVWCHIIGTDATPGFYDSHNCSSVTDIGTGIYQVNFTNNMGSANNYSVLVSNWRTLSDHEGDNCYSNPTASSCRSESFQRQSNQTNIEARISMLIFGD